ncbi:MAG: M24 family metallopeptidase [Acidimicrobiales bacterium]
MIADMADHLHAWPARPDLPRMGAERLAKLRRGMSEAGVDALVLLHGPNITYATGHLAPPVDVTHAVFRRPVAIVTNDRVSLHVACPRGGSIPAETLVRPELWPELDEGAPAVAAAIAEMVGSTSGRRIAVDEVTGAMRRGDVLAGAELVDAARIIGPAKLVKTPDELTCITIAQRLNEQAMDPALDATVPGARRSDVAGAFLGALHELGGDANHIDPIFEVLPPSRDVGPRTSTGHIAFPVGVVDPVLAVGDVVWVDSGIGHEGYMSDFGRTWVVGRDPDRAERALFDRWCAVMQASLDAIEPGASLGDVARAAEAADQVGRGPGAPSRPWLPHFYLAHGLGIESAEMPMVGTDLGAAFDVGFQLATGMVLVLEPVIWQDGVGGYRAEEIVAVTDDGWQLLGGGHPYAPFGEPT